MLAADLPDDPTARHTAILRELADIGMDIARSIQRLAAEDPKSEMALTFSRIAKAVRQTLALETRIAQEGFADSQRRAVGHQNTRERAEFIERVRVGERESTAWSPKPSRSRVRRPSGRNPTRSCWTPWMAS